MLYQLLTHHFLLIQQSVNIIGIDLSLIPSVGLCLCMCRSVRKVYFGMMADWIWMPFGVVIIEGKGTVLGVNL